MVINWNKQPKSYSLQNEVREELRHLVVPWSTTDATSLRWFGQLSEPYSEGFMIHGQSLHA